jgi:hypothetical protein
MIAGEYVVGLLILAVVLVCILVAALISVTEVPKYLRHTQK